MKVLLYLIILGFNTANASYYAGCKRGWFWYEKPIEKKEKKNVFECISPNLTPHQWQEEVRKRIDSAYINLNKNRDIKSAKKVLKINKEIMDGVKEVREVYAYTQQMYPELDPRVNTPNNETGWRFFNNERTIEENKTLQKLSKRYGLIFFFNGGQPMSEFMCRVVAAFGMIHGFHIMPIAVNGKTSKTYPQATKDDVVFQQLILEKKITKAPSIVAFDQEKNRVIPVQSGYAAVSDLRRNVLRIEKVGRWKS